MILTVDMIASEYNGNIIIAPLEWSDLWKACEACEQAKSGQWVETTENMYNEMLGTVPPAAYRDNGFLMGDPLHENEEGDPVWHAFVCFKISGKLHYFCRNLSIKEFRAL